MTKLVAILAHWRLAGMFLLFIGVIFLRVEQHYVVLSWQWYLWLVVGHGITAELGWYTRTLKTKADERAALVPLPYEKDFKALDARRRLRGA